MIRWIFLLLCVLNLHCISGEKQKSSLEIKEIKDFEIMGDGMSLSWENTDWVILPVQQSSMEFPYTTKFKIAHSKKGIYVLFLCSDSVITSDYHNDFESLFEGDVVEVFLQPRVDIPIYFEMEISPKNYILPLMVPNIDGKFQGWLPFEYNEDRKVIHKTCMDGSGNWSAELFIPYELLYPIVQEPPQKGEVWKANFYRIDYDLGYSSWSWMPTTPNVGGSFHEYEKFGEVQFK